MPPNQMDLPWEMWAVTCTVQVTLPPCQAIKTSYHMSSALSPSQQRKGGNGHLTGLYNLAFAQHPVNLRSPGNERGVPSPLDFSVYIHLFLTTISSPLWQGHCSLRSTSLHTPELLLRWASSSSSRSSTSSPLSSSSVLSQRAAKYSAHYNF